MCEDETLESLLFSCSYNNLCDEFRIKYSFWREQSSLPVKIGSVRWVITVLRKCCNQFVVESIKLFILRRKKQKIQFLTPDEAKMQAAQTDSRCLVKIKEMERVQRTLQYNEMVELRENKIQNFHLVLDITIPNYMKHKSYCLENRFTELVSVFLSSLEHLASWLHHSHHLPRLLRHLPLSF